MRRSLALLFSLLLTLGVSACGDDKVKEKPKTCDDDPTMPQCPKPCATGKVTGRICAPDAKTWVTGAEVFSTGECNGFPFNAHAVADDEGRFTLDLPAGQRDIVAVSGSFQRTYRMQVDGGQTSAIADDQLCFQRDTAKLAVITGHDKIDNTLEGLGFEVDRYAGSGDAFNRAGGGKELLLDPAKLASYDVLFISCAAARINGKIDLGRDAQAIAKNLREFVANGGSLYASDWAFVFIQLAFDKIDWRTKSGQVNLPFDTNELMGAAQTIDAQVVDTQLGGYLGKQQLPITFMAGKSVHWGLINNIREPAVPLLRGNAKLCDGSKDCTGSRGVANDVPLAVLLDTSDRPGGAVVYTSFHVFDDPSSTSSDVQQILKYMIFKL